jgi:hypothetical protein
MLTRPPNAISSSDKEKKSKQGQQQEKIATQSYVSVRLPTKKLDGPSLKERDSKKRETFRFNLTRAYVSLCIAISIIHRMLLLTA